MEIIYKNIQSKEFSNLSDDIQKLISSAEAKINCSDVCSILKELCHAVVPSSSKTTYDENILLETLPCINLCIDYSKRAFSFTDLVAQKFFTLLYRLIHTFLSAELYQPALSLARIFQTFLEDAENNFDDKGLYIKDTHIIFWNAPKTKELMDHDTALSLRTISIEFLFLDKPSIESIDEKINLTITRYCHYNTKINIEKICAFLEDMWLHLQKFYKDYDHKAYLYKLLKTWFKMLNNLKDISFLKPFLVWCQNLSKACDETQKILKTCSSISNHIIQFFFLLDTENNFEQIFSEYISFCKTYKHWNDTEIEILANTCSIVYFSFTSFLSSYSEDKNSSEFMKSNISALLLIMCHFLDMISEEIVQKYMHLLSFVKYHVCFTVASLLLTLLKEEQDATKKKDIINKAEEFVKLSFSKISLKDFTESKDAGKYLFNFASCITNIGKSVYELRLYSESLYFFEVGDEIFSICSSLLVDSREKVQVSLWNLHVYFTHACCFASFYTKALKIVIRSLISHPEKTKECFELWCKVKEHAILCEDKSLSSKIVSDFLLKMSTKVEAEMEITFLVEEFKICKSKRSNFETELIAVLEKLFKMSCSDAIKAYLLQEVLTLPLNLSEIISAQLQKTLPEICLEAICLFEDHLSKNTEDYAAKLYLSSAYFWLYHHKKEALNMLKPSSPPCVAEHNDVKKENDTSDSQPVPHVSVSIENGTFKYLDLAVQLWDSISNDGWQKVSLASKETNILDIIVASAEIYSAAVLDSKELELWIILKSASSAVGSKLHELIGSISLINLLIRLGYLNMASHFLETVEDQAEILERNDFKTLKLKFLLSKSNYYFHIGRFDDGLKILKEILASSVTIGVDHIIKVESMLLLAEYLYLSAKAFVDSDCKDYVENNSCLTWVFKAVKYVKNLKNSFPEKEACAKELYWVCLKPPLIKTYLNAFLKCGEYYLKFGEINSSIYYLENALRCANSQILTYWSSKILILLGHINLMCDNFKDCRVQMKKLQEILATSPNELVISTAPDNLLQDKIPVMSSAISEMSKCSQYTIPHHIESNFSEENFSRNLLLLESSFLFYLLSQTETDSKESTEALQDLLNHCSSLKNAKHLSNILSIKLTYEGENPLFRQQSKLEVLFYVSIQMQKLEFYCIKNDPAGAKKVIDESFHFLKEASNCPKFSYSEIYALLKYHDIRVSLCESYKISLNSSLVYYICPSVKSHRFLKISSQQEKSGLESPPVIPSSNKIPKTVNNKLKHQTKKCKTPLKKKLLNTNLKKDIEIEKRSEAQTSGQDLPNIIFGSSEDENFESPCNLPDNLSYKTRSGQEKTLKKDGKASKYTYKIFKSKNKTAVSKSSNKQNLCLTDTPKLGKIMKGTSIKKDMKAAQISKKKTRSANSETGNELTKSSKTRSTKAKANECEISTKAPKNTKLNDFYIDLMNSMNLNVSERKLSVENSMSSPSSQTRKSPNPIDDLCKDLYSVDISKSSSSPYVVVENLKEVIEELYELRLLIQNCMPYPLYSNICNLLAVLLLRKQDGSWNEEKVPESSFLLSEAFSVSLRNIYISHLMYYKNPEIAEEQNIISKVFLRTRTNKNTHVESLLKLVPEKWSVVQVTSLHSQEYLNASDKQLPCPTKFIFSRYRKNSKPVIVCTDSSSSEKISTEFLVEFGKILAESHLTSINTDINSGGTARSSLDARMKDFTISMENMWLKSWKGMFLGIPQNEERVTQICSTVDDITKVTPCNNVDLLQILIDSANNLSSEQVCTAVCYIWNCSHEENVHNKLCDPIRNISRTLPKTERHPVILILDQSVQELPWESMKILKGVPVTRMPSLSILHAKLYMMDDKTVLENGFNSSETYYVLNPDGHFRISTQDFFQHRFEKQTGWRGVAGKAPVVEDFISGFKDHELLIYCGQRSCFKYFKNTFVKELNFKSTSVLMGSFTGKLYKPGKRLEASGHVLNLLLTGCPAITANLWNMTEKDIQSFTEKLLQFTVPHYGNRMLKKYNIAKAVALARRACKFLYIGGSSPVVYGFPMYANLK